jgi:hypothetical protein
MEPRIMPTEPSYESETEIQTDLRHMIYLPVDASNRFG